MAFTFQLCDVERATRPLPEAAPREVLQVLLGTPVEACGVGSPGLVASEQNAFLAAAWRAYAEHRPLVLTPDAVWLCIAQGFAAHVNHDAEALRGRFVRHEGRKKLVVRRDDFIKGSPDNPWPGVFAAFSDQIAGHVGRQRDLVVCDFSTTGPVERAASELVLMDAMQQYFEYELLVICGIPEVTLAGTVDDWRSVRRRAATLAEYDLEWWTSVLLPVLGELEATAAGRPDLAFWRHFIEDSGGGCGGGGSTAIHGWILLFFPYLLDANCGDGSLHRSDLLLNARGASPIDPAGGPADWLPRERLEPDTVPIGLARAPLEWRGLDGTHYPMDLIGGFVGIAQDPATLALRPAIGWAVRDRADAVRVREPHPRYQAASGRILDSPLPEVTDEDIADLFSAEDTEYRPVPRPSRRGIGEPRSVDDDATVYKPVFGGVDPRRPWSGPDLSDDDDA